MEKTTILQVLPELVEGGVELATVEMAKGIVLSGADSLVVAEPGRLVSDLEAGGSRYIRADMATKNPLKIVKNIFVLRAIIKKHNVSLIHARSRAPAWSAFGAAKLTSIPYLATHHGAHSENFPLKRFYNSVMARGALTIANSYFMKSLIAARYNLSKSRIRVIYCGVDFSVFDPKNISAAQKEGLRQKWGVKPEHPILLLAARLTRIKGHDVVIEAVKTLKQEGLLGDHVFIFAGGETKKKSFTAELKDKVVRYGLEDHIKFVGHVDDMMTAYAISTVSMSCSIVPETFGRTGAEAQAMECPIIVTDLGAPKETCLAAPKSNASEITGWIIEAKNPQSLVDVLKTVFEMPVEARDKMGKRARRYVSEKFQIDQMRRQTLEVYDELLGGDLAERFKRANK